MPSCGCDRRYVRMSAAQMHGREKKLKKRTNKTKTKTETKIKSKTKNNYVH